MNAKNYYILQRGKSSAFISVKCRIDATSSSFNFSFTTNSSMGMMLSIRPSTNQQRIFPLRWWRRYARCSRVEGIFLAPLVFHVLLLRTDIQGANRVCEMLSYGRNSSCPARSLCSPRIPIMFESRPLPVFHRCGKATSFANEQL